MKKFKSKMIKVWKEESAQGMTEYIIILIAIVTIAFVFREQIEGIWKDLEQKLNNAFQR